MLAKDQGWWTSSDHGAFGAVNPFYEMMYQHPFASLSKKLSQHSSHK